MSFAAREHPDINRASGRNVNSSDCDIEGFWHPMMGASFFANTGGEHRGGGEPAKKRKWTEQHRGTQPVTGNSLSTGPIFQEPRYKTGEPAPEETEVYGIPVREPPAWKLRYKVGSGAFGTMFLEMVQTREMALPELWAVKQVSKAIPSFPAKRYQAEIKNLETMSKYEWFVKFYSSYEDRHYVYIAMEYIPIGDMQKTFANGYRWNESDTKVVVQQLLQGLAAMHKEGITHRDLKPENIFLWLPPNEAGVLRVKIGDFGVSKYVPLFNPTTFLRTIAGTVAHMAPEIDGESEMQTNRIDIWSLGCIMYRMVAGCVLFNSRHEVWRYSMSASSPPPAVGKVGFSIPCVDFLRAVLEPGAKIRPSAETCLTMPWITNSLPGLQYSIGRDLYTRLAKVNFEAPDLDSFSDVVIGREADTASLRSLSTMSTELGINSAPFRGPPNWGLWYKIGSGAFGTIFLEKVQLRGKELPELWAVKQVLKTIPNFPARRYQAEIKNLEALSKYKWFVKFNRWYEDYRFLYIAMEYIPIRDMGKTFAKGYRWNEEDTRVVAEQLLQGLVVMHKEGITHRDLKPENIFLCLSQHEPRVLHAKIGDFGSSKYIPLSNATTCLRTTVGTEGYMAPEMDDTELKDQPVTNRVDIWSLGCVVYRMVTGSILFLGRREVWRYSMEAFSPPPVVEKVGLSLPCVDFLCAVLQPNGDTRASAETCLTMSWIANSPPGSQYSISKDLHSRLAQITFNAPDIDAFSEAVAISGSG